MHVSEICVNQILVNQGLGVHNFCLLSHKWGNSFQSSMFDVHTFIVSLMRISHQKNFPSPKIRVMWGPTACLNYKISKQAKKYILIHLNSHTYIFFVSVLQVWSLYLVRDGSKRRRTNSTGYLVESRGGGQWSQFNHFIKLLQHPLWWHIKNIQQQQQEKIHSIQRRN